MNLQELLSKMAKPKKPYVLGNGKPNKYNKTSLDGHRVLKNGSIVVRTYMVSKRTPKGTQNILVDANYDKDAIKDYQKSLKKSA